MEQDCLKCRRRIMRTLLPRCTVISLATTVILHSIPLSTASADGVDVVWLMTRVGGWRLHPALSVAMVVGLMLLNYALNVVFIGIPAARSSSIKKGVIARDLAGFTIIGQIADRIGALAGLIFSFAIMSIVGMEGEAALRTGFLAGAAANFILSGLAVGALAFWYLTRRWQVERRCAKVIALFAGLITNPGWVMIPWLIPQLQ